MLACSSSPVKVGEGECPFRGGSWGGECAVSGGFTEKETEAQTGNRITRGRRLGLDSAPRARPASRSPWRAHAHLVPGPGSDGWAGPPGDPARDSEARLGISGSGPGSAPRSSPEQEERSGLSL